MSTVTLTVPKHVLETLTEKQREELSDWCVEVEQLLNKRVNEMNRHLAVYGFVLHGPSEAE